MSKKNTLIPELRFPEFITDVEWEGDIVDKLIFTITPPKKLTTSNYLESGRFPIIDQSKSFYCGWTNDSDAVITENLPLIIFGDHTCVLKMATEPFVQGADGIKILNPKSKITPEFLYHFLQHNEVKQEEYKRHFSILKERNIFFPKLEKGEQQKIASCLSSLDEVIAAHSQKLATLKDHKKGLMQNLFPTNSITNDELEITNVPNYRFPEFLEDEGWVEKKLGDKEVSYFVNEKTSVDKLNVNSYVSTENMLPEFSGVSTSSKLPSLGNFTKFKNGDILISNIRPYLKKVWKADKIGGASNDVLVFRYGSEVLSEFLECIIKNEAFINYVMEGAKGVKMPRGDKDYMQKYIVVLTPYKLERFSILLT